MCMSVHLRIVRACARACVRACACVTVGFAPTATTAARAAHRRRHRREALLRCAYSQSVEIRPPRSLGSHRELSKGYRVQPCARRSACVDSTRVQHRHARVHAQSSGFSPSTDRPVGVGLRCVAAQAPRPSSTTRARSLPRCAVPRGYPVSTSWVPRGYLVSTLDGAWRAIARAKLRGRNRCPGAANHMMHAMDVGEGCI
jgi:hypothetical protein